MSHLLIYEQPFWTLDSCIFALPFFLFIFMSGVTMDETVVLEKDKIFYLLKAALFKMAYLFNPK